jgi:hypothetical protein
MATSGLGQKRIARAESSVSLRGMKRDCRSLWLDSGAHSLYNMFVIGGNQEQRHNWFRNKQNRSNLSRNFRRYLDEYAKFVLEHKSGIDYYANVDVIYNPELSWKALKYLEDKGLKPVPVIHARTPLKWVTKHVEAGYKYIGLGGLGQESTKNSYVHWADQVYDQLCNNPDRLPCVRTHGFAMTSYELLLRYPWWSTDSTSAYRVAGTGSIFVPHMRGGKFTFEEAPYIIAFSHRSSVKGKSGKHYATLKPKQQEILRLWLKEIEMPMGAMGDNDKSVEYGVCSEYNARAVANLKFFQKLCDWLPKWPWPFRIKPRKGFFPLEDIG